MGSCNWLLIFYSTKCLGRLLDGLRSPQVVARGVRRAQRREARLGDVDGGREAAEARENDASSPGAAATWTLTSFTLQAMIASWRQAAAMPWQARRLMAPRADRWSSAPSPTTNV